MKVFVKIGHPGHVHLFKNLIWNLENRGHEVKIAAKDRGIIFELLDAYDFAYEKFDKHRDSLNSKALGLVIREFKILKMVRDFKPDISVAMGPIPLSHVSKLINKPCISFTDTEHDRFERLLSDLFVNAICTPSCFKKDLGKKQVRYNGYHELAYLHPNYFKPDSSVLDELGLSRDDKFIILRLVSWNAAHDIGDRGFVNMKEVVYSLERYARVLITSETKLTSDFEKYKITVPPEKIHHLLYFADLYIGESATMASESAILGTPSVFVSTSRRGYTDELESRYGLVYNFPDPQKGQDYALKKAFELLKDKKLKKNWEEKRRRMLDEKIDVTKFMTDFIENYPESFFEYKKGGKII